MEFSTILVAECIKMKVLSVDGKNYYCKSSGEAVELSKNGWNLVDGNYLYVKMVSFERMPRENRGCLLLFWLFRSYAFRYNFRPSEYRRILSSTCGWKSVYFSVVSR